MSQFPSVSKVQICGINKHDCGYCKDSATEMRPKNSSISYGFVSASMTAEDYQSLMLTGWRRSGTYFYKPLMHKTCCPQYTIRLRVNEHTQSKSQKKVMKNVKKFLSEAPDDSSYSTEDNLKISPMFTFTGTGKALEAESTPTTPSSRHAMKLTVELERPSVTTEKFELYKRYQIDVHHDKAEDLSEQGFRRFLVDSPLKGSAVPSPAPVSSPTTSNTKANSTNNTLKPSTMANSTDVSSQYGTFHQLYRLNGQLIAVGVVDILPLGLSSVYLFYDNNYKQLSLGKYTALQEIEYCKTHSFEYYFMGFYIHTCEKMKYKGEYKPSDLLCPTTLQWYPLSHCSAILDKFNFSPFEPALAARRARIQADVGLKSSADGKNGNTGTNNNNSNSNSAVSTTSTTNTNTTTSTSPKKNNNSNSSSTKQEPDSSEGSDSEEEEEEDTVVLPSPLDEFAPIFNYNSTTTSNSDSSAKTNVTASSNTTPTISALLSAASSIPLDVGLGRAIALSDLKPESIRHLQPFLQEWLEHVGPANAARITVSLV